jgi:hypothetical protein
MTTSKLPPHDSNGFYLPDGRPCPGGFYRGRTPPIDREVKTAIAYLSQLTPTKRPTYSSYYLKHRAENWGKRHGHCSYVSNGALIEAAIRLGLTIKPISINAHIGVSVRDVKALWAGQACCGFKVAVAPLWHGRRPMLTHTPNPPNATTTPGWDNPFYPEPTEARIEAMIAAITKAEHHTPE